MLYVKQGKWKFIYGRVIKDNNLMEKKILCTTWNYTGTKR